jgi:iron complex transport system ATP-binding protein
MTDANNLSGDARTVATPTVAGSAVAGPAVAGSAVAGPAVAPPTITRGTVARLEGATSVGRLENCDLLVESGRCVVLVGPNGAGKSSALSALLGLLPLSRGRALLGETPLAQLRPQHRAAQLAWLPQRPRLSSDLTIMELVQQARFRFAEAPAVSIKQIRPILEQMGLLALETRRTSEVSGGELQRALLAALMAQGSPLLLVDEPANHLDPSYQLDTYSRLGDLWRQGHGLCVVTHDIRLCQVLGPAEDIQVVGMRHGTPTFRRTLADPLLPEELQRLYGVAFLSQGQPGALAIRLPEGGP